MQRVMIEPIFTVKETGDILKLERQTVLKMCKNGMLKGYIDRHIIQNSPELSSTVL